MMPDIGVAAPNVPPAVARRAVQWILDLQASDNPTDTGNAIRHWCASHPDHQRAWQHIEQLNQQFNVLANPQQANLAQQALTESGRSRRQVLKTLSLLLVAGAASYGANESGLLNHWRADYHTATGEQRTVSLAGGTKITLNSATSVQVKEQEQHQHIRLLDGEIHIASTAQHSKPLLVETDQGFVRPLGTRFALRQMDEQCRLAVYEGQVELQPRHSQQRCILNPGDSTLFTVTGWSPLKPTTPEETAWTDGMIIVRALPLQQFINELSRYRSGILRVDPAIAQLSVSGTYPVTQTDTVLKALAEALPIRLHSLTRYWISVLPA